VSAAAVAGPIENYSPVTAQRLENPEPGNWMLYRRTYDGQGYSPLDQINTTNVKNLTPVWTFSTGVIEGHEAPPIVNNGVMFIATPMGQVIALNAKTGDEYWRYKRLFPTICSNCIRPAEASACGRTSFISPPRTTIWSRSMPRPARCSGIPRFRTTRRVNISL
jgi:glucose dehydrogenase